MFVQKLIINNFKNNSNSEINFKNKISIFVGDNGTGKTNILEAIYYFSVLKSYLNVSDKDLVKKGNDFFYISCLYLSKNIENLIECGFRVGEKKNIKFNKKKYEKISEHIGIFPVIFFSPYDTDLIREGSEFRRKFFDLVISIQSSSYLKNLIEYNSYLEQRNHYLKIIKEKRITDYSLIETYNQKIIPLGEDIHQQRKNFIPIFLESFLHYYKLISDDNETVTIKYQSQLLNENYAQLLTNVLQKDLALERTTVGVHKDDYSFLINDKECKTFASQGQQKSFVIALKLAMFQIIKVKKEINSIVLLDDIFDRLDSKRAEILMQIIRSDDFGQVFITDTDSKKIKEFFLNSKDLSIFRVENGNITIEEE